MAQFEQLLEATQDHPEVQVVTLVQALPEQAQSVGEMLLLYPDGHSEGCLIDQNFTDEVLRQLQEQVWQGPRLLEIAEGKQQVFWDKWLDRRKALVLGGGHISQPLVQFLAQLDFDVTVVDDRPDFANAVRFPEAQRVVCNSFAQAIMNLQSEMNDQTAVIIVTRGHRYDLECLRKILTIPVGYLGMIGSKRRVREIVHLLVEEGFSPDLLQKVYAPIGIDLGGALPAEIALSIAAEIIAVFNQGSLRFLTLTGKAEHHYE